ncbi:hypothetical protein ACIQF6_16975 [Kitasatospora sp. NPDC092948]|uniref:hypothetical protein n=1 Tax=Kitasatospora sp. NPDC092948 TaxID=3364088 RepID=UPI0037F78431
MSRIDQLRTKQPGLRECERATPTPSHELPEREGEFSHRRRQWSGDTDPRAVAEVQAGPATLRDVFASRWAAVMSFAREFELKGALFGELPESGATGGQQEPVIAEGEQSAAIRTIRLKADDEADDEAAGGGEPVANHAAPNGIRHGVHHSVLDGADRRHHRLDRLARAPQQSERPDRLLFEPAGLTWHQHRIRADAGCRVPGAERRMPGPANTGTAAAQFLADGEELRGEPAVPVEHGRST